MNVFRSNFIAFPDQFFIKLVFFFLNLKYSLHSISLMIEILPKQMKMIQVKHVIDLQFY
jgi:hypothetical protein